MEMGCTEPDAFVRAENSRRIWDVKLLGDFSVQPPSDDPMPLRFDDECCSMSLSSCGSMLIIGTRMEMFRIYSTLKGTNNWTSSEQCNIKVTHEGRLRIHGELCNWYFPSNAARVRWHPTSTDVFTSSGGSNSIQIWSTASLKVVDAAPRPSLFPDKMGYYKHNMNPAQAFILAGAPDFETTFDLLDLRVGLKYPTYQSKGPNSFIFKKCYNVNELIWNPAAPNRIATATIYATRVGTMEKYNQLDIQEWDIRSPYKPVVSYDVEDFGKRFPSEYCGIRFSSDGQHLYSASAVNFCEYSTLTGKKGRSITLPGNTMDLTHYREFCVTSGSNPEIAFVPYIKGMKIIDLESFVSMRDIEIPCLYGMCATVVDSERQVVYTCSRKDGVSVYASLPNLEHTDNTEEEEEEEQEQEEEESSGATGKYLITLNDLWVT